MAKFFVFAAMVLALLALAQASRFTITTTVDEEDNQYGQGQTQRRCQQQIQQQMEQIRHCQQYLSTPGGPFEMDMIIQQTGQQGQRHLRQCCMALQNFSEQCRCEAVRQALRMQQGQGGWQGQGQQQQMQQMRMKARFLPQQCNMGPRECQV